MRRYQCEWVYFLFLATAFGLTARAQEWTRFRGPNGTGVSGAQSLPTQWSAADYAWRVALPGEGHSSPVLWGEKIFLMSADPQTAMRYVLCYSASDGSELWRREFPSSPHPLHARNGYASGTPAVDAQRVYVAWSTPQQVLFLALDHAGRDVWSLDLGSSASQHGFGTSPMLFEDMVILSNNQDAEDLLPGQEPGESYMLAVDAKTGQQRWRSPRTSIRVCYSTPCIYQPPGSPPQLVCTSTAEGVYSLDPHTGRENWKVPECFRMRVVSSPLVTDRLIFGSTGSGGGGNYLVAVRPGEKPGIAYQVRSSAPYVPAALAQDDLLFLLYDRGVLSCVDLETGEPHWRQRLGGNFSASPVLGDGKIYCASDEGDVFVVAADKAFQLLAQNPLGEGTRATPAIAGDRLYFRTVSHLMAVGNAQ